MYPIDNRLKFIETRTTNWEVQLIFDRLNQSPSDERFGIVYRLWQNGTLVFYTVDRLPAELKEKISARALELVAEFTKTDMQQWSATVEDGVIVVKKA